MSKGKVIATFLIGYTFIQPGLSNPAIGFSALLSHDAYLGNYETIKYDNVITNSGNCYNKWSGHFVAPRRGLYVFSCSVKATNTNHITVGIIKNGHLIMKVSSAQAAWESGSRTVVLALNKRDTVWVRRLAHDRSIISHYNSFSGYLISTET